MSIQTIFRAAILALISVQLGFSQGQVQDGPALDFVGTSTNGFNFALTLGWSFEVHAPVKVDALGFFDHFESDEDGLGFDHLVRLWTDQSEDGQIDPVLLASTTITNSSTPVSTMADNGRWLFNPISPIVLGPGRYVIGADDPACSSGCDRYRMVVNEFTIPEISFGEARSTSAYGPPLSDQPNLNGGYFGPNFAATPILLGDVNGDGAVDLLDVNPFVTTIGDDVYIIEADMNLDGIVDLLDVALFIDALTGT